MTIYITPMGNRIARRRVLRFAPDWPWTELEENRILFPVDVRVEPEAYQITAFVPGIKPEELNIQIVDKTVAIQGELKDETDEEVTYLIKELPSGKFNRVINLPDPLDANGAEARVENGVLTLRVPKAETVRPRTIKVVSK